MAKEAPKLVYTSDRSSKQFLNNITPPLVEKSEIISTIHGDIDLMNKSRKRSVIMSTKVSTRSDRLSEELWKKIFTLVVKALQHSPTTKKDLFSIVVGSGLLPSTISDKEKWTDNLMQLLKYASFESIYPHDGKWCIQSIAQPIDAYVNELYKNKHRRFTLPKEKGTKEKKSKAPKQEIPIGGKLLPSKIDVAKKDIELILSSKGIHIEATIEPDAGVTGDIGVTKNSVYIKLNW